MMRWFTDKLDDKIKAMVTELVSAYIERSQLSLRLLLLEPNLTDIEMAVLWLGGVAVMEGTHANAAEKIKMLNEEDQEEVRIVHEVTREFFDSCCQSYISEVCKSSINLDFESSALQEVITPTLEAMSLDQASSSSKILSGLMSNAMRLAVGTVNITFAGLTQEQGKDATKYALSLVSKNSDLNIYERTKTTEWITRVAWGRPR
jgi:hypothetical protein